MKIIIISDIHDNQVNLKKTLDWAKRNKTSRLICCGDVTNSDTLSYLSHNFDGEIHLVRGNADSFSEQEMKKFKNIKYYDKIGLLNIADTTIGICHEPFLIEKVIELCQKDIPQVIFYGHTHKPWIEERDGIKLINPGSLGAMFQKGTFTFWDTKALKLELMLLEQI